jgi:SAM-dependent methyltransferase
MVRAFEATVPSEKSGHPSVDRGGCRAEPTLTKSTTPMTTVPTGRGRKHVTCRATRTPTRRFGANQVRTGCRRNGTGVRGSPTSPVVASPWWSVIGCASHEVMNDPSDEGLSVPTRARATHPDFDDSYRGSPPWDIGRPQPVFLRLADAGAFVGRVLDVGCGTGEHVLLAAQRGLEATGVDCAPRAIAAAQRKAADRSIPARFLVWDALRLAELGERFDTVIDSGLFHVFNDEDRAQYVNELDTVLQPGGSYLMCCFSDRQPGEWGPRRVSQEDIEGSFGMGWTVTSIERARFVTTLDPPFAEAWLAIITHS